MKIIPTYQKRALAELHIRVEELRPEYSTTCEFRKYEFESRIYDENDIVLLGFHVEHFSIELGAGATKLDAYQKKLAALVDQLASESA